MLSFILLMIMNLVQNNKPTLIYFSPDCFTQVDDTVLHHLVNDFNVVWFYQYESMKAKDMRYNPEKAQEYADRHNIKLEVVDHRMRGRDLRNVIFYHSLARRINAYHPDIVYACLVYPFWTYCYYFIHCKIKVLGIHDVTLHSYHFSIPKRLIQINKVLWFKHFKSILTFSKSQHDLLKNKLNKDSIMVGMSSKDFGASALHPPIKSNRLDLLFFGTINKYKGLDMLIKAIEDLHNEGIGNIRLTIAGKGPSWKECHSLIRHSELYNLQIRFIDNSEIPDLMCSHHFIVLPYINATQSGPLVTAINYDLPAIAPNYGCFSETCAGGAGLLYNPGKLKETLRLAYMMGEEEYVNLRQTVSRAKESFSEERIGHNYVVAFKKILGQR